MTDVGDLKSTAVAAGFDPERDYLGYSVEAMSAFILQDEKFVADFDRNWLREIAETPGAHSHPDHVLLATLESYSELEKAALRRRVWVALQKWDGK